MSESDNGFWLDLDEATIRDLEKRLSSAASALEAESTMYTGAPAAAEKVASAVAPPPSPAKGAPAQSKGFLAELALEVEQQKSHAPVVNRDAAQINDALAGIFSFLNKMSDYSNELSPKIQRTYRLDTKTLFVGLRWHGAHADARKQDLSEKALISHVSFRASLLAARSVSVVRRWDMMAALRNDLAILGLRMVEDQVFTAKSGQEFEMIELEPEIPVQLYFQGDYDKQEINVLGRNLEGFGVSAFVLNPADAGDAFLDQLGRFLLGRSDRLPDVLRRVNYTKPV